MQDYVSALTTDPPGKRNMRSATSLMESRSCRSVVVDTPTSPTSLLGASPRELWNVFPDHSPTKEVVKLGLEQPLIVPNFLYTEDSTGIYRSVATLAMYAGGPQSALLLLSTRPSNIRPRDVLCGTRDECILADLEEAEPEHRRTTQDSSRLDCIPSLEFSTGCGHAYPATLTRGVWRCRI